MYAHPDAVTADARKVRALQRELVLTRSMLASVFVLFAAMAALALWSARETARIAGDAITAIQECEMRRAAMASALMRYDSLLTHDQAQLEMALARLQQCGVFVDR